MTEEESLFKRISNVTGWPYLNGALEYYYYWDGHWLEEEEPEDCIVIAHYFRKWAAENKGIYVTLGFNFINVFKEWKLEYTNHVELVASDRIDTEAREVIKAILYCIEKENPVDNDLECWMEGSPEP